MNCFTHPENVSVATCIDCGKGLCKECASLYTFPICNVCNTSRVQNDKNTIKKKLIPSIIGAVIGIILALLMSFSSSFTFFDVLIIFITLAYGVASIPWGWAAITFIQPKMFLFMSYFGWIVYFMIKIMLAYFIGLVVMPIGLFKLLKNHKIASEKERNIQNNL